MTEQDLVKQCIAGNRKAQKRLYDTYKAQLYTKALRILNDREKANDALQEGYIDIFRSLNEFKFEGSLYAWMRTIVIRKALYANKMERYFEELNEITYDKQVQWTDNLTAEYLEEAISCLPPGYRAVFTLLEIEGFSHREAAELLELSEGTTKSQLYHSKKLLQKKLLELYRP